jgi:hypothetical protein
VVLCVLMKKFPSVFHAFMRCCFWYVVGFVVGVSFVFGKINEFFTHLWLLVVL